ncbi:uncharacterized protein [Littorina saxatilis]|uniref:Ig-like domain-containing protein n=1 Tax=Littorina saxatilis TaxID=31220 RepID=A0AAN9AMJ1_9CAEN
MATMHVIATTVAIFFMTSSVSAATTKDVTIPYYGDAILSCFENATDMPGPGGRWFWITPGATVIDGPGSEFPKNVELVNKTEIHMLNVTKVDDDQFGYYTCVIINSMGNVTLMRWGVNVNGADFSALEEQYRESAIIGAIAAGVMLVVVGGACIIWNYRYSKRSRSGNSSERSSSIEDDLKKPSPHMYANEAYVSSHVVTPADIEMVETPDEKTNGSAAVTDGDDGEKNGGAESFRM